MQKSSRIVKNTLQKKVFKSLLKFQTFENIIDFRFQNGSKLITKLEIFLTLQISESTRIRCSFRKAQGIMVAATFVYFSSLIYGVTSLTLKGFCAFPEEIGGEVSPMMIELDTFRVLKTEWFGREWLTFCFTIR